VRVIAEQRNPWGLAGAQSQEAQRTDLWVVDLSQAEAGINSVLGPEFDRVQPVPAYFAQSVALPQLETKAEPVRRDSRSYNMPSWDEPLGTTRMTFILDARGDARSSRIYALLDRWRMLVRAGRGQVGTESLITLDDHYRIDYAFAIPLTLLRGGSLPELLTANEPAAVSGLTGFSFGSAGNFTADRERFLAEARQQLSLIRQNTSATVPLWRQVGWGWEPDNDLEISGLYLLEKAWLGSFKMSDWTYEGAKVATLEATFYRSEERRVGKECRSRWSPYH